QDVLSPYQTVQPSSPTALHAIALETINTRFPPEEWLHIYTDGSLLDVAQGAGIGVFSHLFSFYLHTGPLTTHFDGEVEAIHIALQQLAVRLPLIERAVILSDSTSALQALSNYNENNCLRVQNCRELLGKIKGKIVFQWVPSHCGLWGNERADFLAKKGTGILQNFRRDLALHPAKLEIERIFRESFRLTASRVARDKPWSTLLTSPICVMCDTGQDMTAAHLDECSALNDLNCIVKRTSTTSSIVPAFLRSTSCGMTSARGHGAIVYYLNSGSEDRQTGHHNVKGTRNRWREGQVCPDVGQGTMAPWARRLWREKKSGENGRKEEGRTEKTGETEKEKYGVRDWSGKTMNAGGVENGNMN
ncbi:uncharacterized protein LOC103521360, partial [Trichonephila clavipes]